MVRGSRGEQTQRGECMVLVDNSQLLGRQQQRKFQMEIQSWTLGKIKVLEAGRKSWILREAGGESPVTVNIKSHHHIPESLGQLHGEQRTTTPPWRAGVGVGGGRVGLWHGRGRVWKSRRQPAKCG